MGSNKAPGPNGVLLAFIRNIGMLLGLLVLNLFNRSLNMVPENFNATLITLIRKKKGFSRIGNTI